MVTNAHVVHTDEEDLYMQFAMTALNEYALRGRFVHRRNAAFRSPDDARGMGRHLNAFYRL